ncbi:putative membrane protein YfcA [Saccharothrix coeruleofusca]|uniref:sulfite exporter TauE/SafE family protein n=1 Tax=Saccharothrix coeruleofusca TaxID=33919 RepID=UPI001AE84ED4|nr:TSUP family transporter [Saccharothrix coeruleofusca]MBP2334227.1 putative membrane protein YfcA [Saccharothrix coeruleofusca]
MTALDWPGFGHVSLAGLLFLCLAAALAGAVDAVVGGGGLIQLPAMLLVGPGGQPLYSLATSKVAAVVGTTAAVRTYTAQTSVDWWSALPMALAAFGGAVGGAAFAGSLAPDVLNAVVLVALVGVGLYTWRKPRLGVGEVLRFARSAQVAVMALGGAVIGFYDGLAGPGTGAFLVFLLVGLVGFAFLRASATAKVVNVATNLGALMYFIPAGKVLWGLGLLLAVCNTTGAVFGARLAVRRGSRFVRRVFLTVVVALVVSLGWKVAAG